MTDTTELKPCPRPSCACRDAQLISGPPGFHHVKCRACGLRTREKYAERAAAEWNEIPRTPDPLLEQMAEALEEARDREYNPFEPDNQTTLYHRMGKVLAAYRERKG